MEQFSIMPVLGRKTNVSQGDSSLLSSVTPNITKSHDVGGVNFDVNYAQESCRKSFGYKAFGGKLIEDFLNDYRDENLMWRIVNDQAGHWSFTDEHTLFCENVTNKEAVWVYKDIGADNIGDFDYRFGPVTKGANPAGGNDVGRVLWMVSDYLTDGYSNKTGAWTNLMIRFEWDTAWWRLICSETDVNGDETKIGNWICAKEEIYIRTWRDNNFWGVMVSTDGNWDTGIWQEFYSSVALADTKYRYLFCGASWYDNTGTEKCNGTLQDFYRVKG